MIGVGGITVKDVYVGTTKAKAVMFRGTQVWPPAKAWFKTFTDVVWQFTSGVWLGNNPADGSNLSTTIDLSDKPAPVRGSMVISVFVMMGSITVEPVVFDGTKWVQTAASMAPRYTVDLHGATAYTIGKWWNGPTAATDYDNWYNDPALGPLPGQSSVALYAAPDGIHIRITDENGLNPTDFVDPYPTGVTQADMPPSADLN